LGKNIKGSHVKDTLLLAPIHQEAKEDQYVPKPLQEQAGI
jgi:hypothetical protein